MHEESLKFSNKNVYCNEKICAIIGIQNSSTSERNAMKEP
jgi:hypothetical protein